MGNKKNIDRLFQEKFKDFEAFPERDLWADIEAKLNGVPSGTTGIPEKQKKTAPVFWWRLGGIAAAIALLLSLGLNFLSTEPADTPDDPVKKVVKDHNGPTEGKETSRDEDRITDDSTPLVSTGHPEDTGKEEEGKTTDPAHSSKTQGSQSSGTGHVLQQETGKDQQAANTGIAAADTSSVENEGNPDKENQIPETRITDVSEQEENIAENPGTSGKNTERATAEGEKTDTPNRAGEEEMPKKSLLEAIAEMESETDREKEIASKQGKGTRKWSINPNMGPVYYNSISGGSPIDPKFEESSKSGKVNLSYGINVAYQVSKRVSVRSGINKVNYGYNTDDITFTPNLMTETGALKNIDYPRQPERASGLYVANAMENNAPPQAAREVASSFAPQEGHLQQEFGYIEVPMEVKYRVVDKRLGLNLIGGVSSLFLTDNAVLAKSESLVTELGKGSNINNVNFSTNLGLGMDYLLSDKFQLQIEPMFKYQWNTFSNDSGGFRPYSFGVYTGFSFRF